MSLLQSTLQLDGPVTPTVFTPRPYQVEAIDAGVGHLQSGSTKHGMLVLPTGAGKSVVIANVTSGVQGKTVVLQPSIEILEQNYKKYCSYGFRGGIYSASAGVKHMDRVTFATIGSIINKKHLFKDFANIIIDECFTGDTYVATENGKMKIGRMASYMQKGRPIPKVVSYNEVTGSIEMKDVEAAKCTGTRTVIELFFSKNIRIRCTENHPFLTSEGWKAAGDLTPGDCILSSKAYGTYALIPNSDQKDLLLGSLLGDGSLDATRRMININRFRFIQGEEQSEYLFWKAHMLCSQVRTVEKNGFAGNKAFAFTSRVMYLPDAHCTKEYAIDNLTARSLAISWMDDGHITRNGNGGSSYACATSAELTERLRIKLLTLGIESIVREGASKLSGRKYYYLVFRKAGVIKLSEVIAPYVHPSLKRKVHSSFWHLVGSADWNPVFGDRGALTLQRTDRNGQTEDVYNIQVADNHTYLIASGSWNKDSAEPCIGAIVHNCHLVNPAEGMYRDFIKATSDASVLGLTATPYRLSSSAGGSMLKFLTRTRPVVFSKVLYYVQTADLFDAGYLAPLEYYSFNVVDRSMLKLNSTGSDFTDASVRAAYRQINMPKHTAHWANRLLAKRNNLLVFCALVDEANETSKLVPGSVVLTGETDKGVRKRILSDFQSNKIRCVINVGVLTTGFDKPDLDTMLMARSTMSLGWYYQVIGRVMRPYRYQDGSVKTGYVVDLAGNIPMFGKIEKLRITYDSRGQICIHNGRRQLTNVVFTKN